jgi:monovalent cation:H+ antiporter-2, CPA2 family
MLASHALVLLGVPLNRVVKRIRLFREARYKMFKGFFPGISDAENASTDNRALRLHTVEITENAFAIGLELAQVDFAQFKVTPQTVRRPNMLEGIAPRADIVLAEGDLLVLLGAPKDLSSAENYLISGQ